MITLRRELIAIILDEIRSEATDTRLHDGQVELSERLADRVISLRAFKATDDEQPEYQVESIPAETQEVPKAGSEAWKALKRLELEKTNPELSMFRGVLPDKDALDSSVSRLEALETFERDMRFNTLPWDSDAAWQKFSKFVVKEHEKDPLIFAKYKTWQENEGKYQALSNRKIRQKPQEFVDCFPDFLAHSAMYGKTQTKPTESKALQFDESGRLISY